MNNDIANSVTEKILTHSGDDSKFENYLDLENILRQINQTTNKLPKWLQWITRKIIDQIPIVEFANSYSYDDVKNQDRQMISGNIEKKIDDFQISKINEIVPFWTKFIIPGNIIFLIFYFQL